MDDREVSANKNERSATDASAATLAMVFCSDLMFATRLHNMARKTGFRVAAARPGADLHDAAVLLVDIADRRDWESIIRQGSKDGISIIAFGPHMDSDARRQAKAAGATRVLANSNLERDLPGILIGIRNSVSTLHHTALNAED